MKQLLTVTIAMLVLAAGALGYPAVGGGNGLFRIQKGMVGETGIDIGAQLFGRNPGTGGIMGNWVGDGILDITYAPYSSQYFGAELFGSVGGLVQYGVAPGDSEKSLLYGRHDVDLGAKLALHVVPVLKLGFGAGFRALERENKPWLDSLAVPGAERFSWYVPVTLHFQQLASSAPDVHFNYGKLGDLSTYGLAVEMSATSLSIFAELRSLQPNGDFSHVFDTDSGDVRATLGTVIRLSKGFALRGGYTMGFGLAPNEGQFGFAIATPFFRKVPKQYGSIAGRVTDQRTGQALAATLRFPEDEKLVPPAIDPNTGVFTADKMPVGIVVVEVSAEGYHSQAVPIEVTANKASQYEFALRPLVTYGVIAGMVTDNANQPVAARAEFPGSDIAAIDVDGSTGSFRVDDVPVGVYTVTASAEGFFKSTLTVTVEEGRVATPTFVLKPLTTRTTLTGKVSDKKSGDPLAATVSFPGSDVAEITNDPETGVYKAEIPVGSYAVKVTSEGYLPQTAAIVLEENKPTIKDFELVKEGMTITLRGIYFDFNKTTIKPESHQALADAAKIMTDNPGIKVEIQGHTDWIGSDEYNQKLSEGRAQAVVTYLVQNFGIDINRLTGKGYGESRPIASNDTEDGRALNRRVEFVILKNE